jgi:hypothetical protein
MQAGAEMLEPLLSQSFETAPAIVRRKSNTEKIAELAIEVTQVALRSDDDADGNVGALGELARDDSQSHRLTRTRLAGDERESSVTNLILQTPAKVLDLRMDPQSVVRQIGRKGVPLETVQCLKLLIHDSSLGVGLANGR